MRDDYVDVSGSSCLNCPFSAELDDMEINTQIRGVLAHGADQNFCSGPFKGRGQQHLGESAQAHFTFLCQFLLLNEYTFLCRVSGTCAAPRGGSPYLRMR
jgi:hypothetical protein